MTQHEFPRPVRPARARARRTAVELIKLVGLRQPRPFVMDVRDVDVQRILLIRLDLLGDLMLTMPAAAYVRARYPHARIDFLTLPYTAPLLDHYPWIDRRFGFDVNQLRPSANWADRSAWEAAAALVRELQATAYDVVFGFAGAWASAFALLSGAPVTAGYQGEGLRNAYSVSLPGARYDRPGHEVEWCLRVATSGSARRRVSPGARYSPARAGYGGAARLGPLPEAQAAVDDLLRAAGAGSSTPLAVLHPGARNGSAKRWPAAPLGQLCDRLRQRGVLPVLTGAKGELPLAADVVRSASRPVIDLCGRTTIPELVALLARAGVVVSGDSAPLHLAVALGAPVVALHGPTAPEISGPWGGRATVVRQRLPCSPCYDATDPAECPLGHHRCLRELPVEAVERAALDALGMA